MYTLWYMNAEDSQTLQMESQFCCLETNHEIGIVVKREKKEHFHKMFIETGEWKTGKYWIHFGASWTHCCYCKAKNENPYDMPAVHQLHPYSLLRIRCLL